MSQYCFINGQLTTSTSISYHDRGFRFGDGLFETINVTNSQPYLLTYHLERLAEGLEILKIKADLSVIKERILKIISHNHHQNGMVRIIVSRGIGSIGYLPHNCSSPTVIIETVNSNHIIRDPVKICVSNIEKISPKALPTSIKLLQGLNSTLAKMDAQERGYFEGILLNQHQHVCEVSSGNIFWAKDGKVYTPDIKCGIVRGVMRRRIIEMLPVITGFFTMKDLLEADEIFITNISWIALPVGGVEKRYFEKHSVAQNIYKMIEQEKTAL